MNDVKLGKDLQIGDIFLNSAWDLNDIKGVITEIEIKPDGTKMVHFDRQPSLPLYDDGKYVIEAKK